MQAQPLFRDPKKYPDMADPLLNKHFPEKDLNQAVAIAAMCLQEESEARPLIGDVVTALSFLSTAPTEPIPPPSLPAATSVSRHSTATESEYDSESESEGETSDDEDTDCEEDNETAQNHVAASENPQKRATSKKSSRKSSTKSRNETTSKDSAEGSASSRGKTSRKWQSFVGNLSQKSNSSSKKSSIKEISQKSSKKTSIKELCQKSSRKSSTKDLSHKSSRKSSAKVSSHKESENGSMNSFHRSASSQYTSSSMSSSSRGSGSVHSDVNGSRRTEESMRLAMESGDEGTNPPFDRMSSSESDRR